MDGREVGEINIDKITKKEQKRRREAEKGNDK
jgi:hypothetical protein